MKPHQIEVLKFGTKYGIITGVIGIIFTVVLIALNMLYNQSIEKTLSGFVVLIVPIITAIYIFKKKNNSLAVEQAIGVGVITALVAAIVTILFTYLLTNFILTDFWDNSAAINRIQLKEQYPAITPEQLQENIALKQKMSWITYPFILLFNLCIGFVVSLLTGIALKTK
ncbi:MULTISPECIES: DUF4199 domain-containing protein [Cellulophaga]|jgi:ABC-type multidrug transport system fused ATPase/permease subunit|uniref:DUF4199 domain-containing protein n=1 Tax=Cellulophaga TaxID=104264 RepID=UPI0003FF02FB|nr:MULTISPECIES: DUF4199 domain-containing protein [Cellulophaga]AIY14940.1 hypothetical protein M667_18205 [Cellulophaga baltica NN016038]KGK30362.1 hypothetical protein EL45_10510 [Cellulophaga sp. E6(2014)]